jgi:hypothetical protein
MTRRRSAPEIQQSRQEAISSLPIQKPSRRSSAPSSEFSKTKNERDEMEIPVIKPPKDTVSLRRSLPPMIHPSPETIVDSIDLAYLNYFMSEMPKIHPYAVIFPGFVPNLMQVATSVAPLRHSLISLAAVIADSSLRRPPVRALLHHQVTLQKVQDLLSLGRGNEDATIYSVMMLAYFNLFSGRFLSARRHLQGISLLLQQYSAKGELPSPTIMLIWRCAIRLDYFVSSLYPCKPIFPTPPPEQEDIHRIWIRMTVTSKGEEWALAQFALDNLQSRAAHLSWLASQGRRIGTLTENEIQGQCTNLLEDFSTWRRRKIFLEQDALDEDIEKRRPSTNIECFLHYPPMKYQNSFYANLLNEYRCAVMFVVFIASPLIGQPSPFDTLRNIHAVDSCRSISAAFPVPMIRILQLVGLVFADSVKFPEECAWIKRQLDSLSNRGVQAASRVKEMLQIVWGNARPWVYEETERIMQNADDLEQLALEEVFD